VPTAHEACGSSSKTFLFFSQKSRFGPISGRQVGAFWRGGRVVLSVLSIFCSYRTTIRSAALHGVFGVNTRHVRGCNTVWLSFNMMCQGSLRGMFRVDTRFVRVRNTVMSGARIGYVGGDTRLCRRRTSVMSAARIGYVRCAHLCIKAVGITIIIVITGTIPHFLLWVVYRKKTQGNSKKRRGSADLRRIDADKKKRRGKRPHGKVKCHAALKASVRPIGCG